MENRVMCLEIIEALCDEHQKRLVNILTKFLDYLTENPESAKKIVEKLKTSEGIFISKDQLLNKSNSGNFIFDPFWQSIIESYEEGLMALEEIRKSFSQVEIAKISPQEYAEFMEVQREAEKLTNNFYLILQFLMLLPLAGENPQKLFEDEEENQT